MYPGIYSGLTYREWKEEQKKREAEQKWEVFWNFVESVKGSAIFYSRKSRKEYIPGRGFNACRVFARVREIVASILFFTVLVGGLNIFAILLQELASIL